MKYLPIIAIALILVACKDSCHNTYWDGNEIGFDCGGDCAPCLTVNDTEALIVGDWNHTRLGYISQTQDTTWNSAPSGEWTFTSDFDIAPSTHHWFKIGYGNFGNVYNRLFGWKVNEVFNHMILTDETYQLFMPSTDTMIWVRIDFQEETFVREFVRM